MVKHDKGPDYNDQYAREHEGTIPREGRPREGASL